MRYRFIGLHADVLSSGQPVAPGDMVELSEEDVSGFHNRSLIDDGHLIEAEEEKGKPKPKTAKGEES